MAVLSERLFASPMDRRYLTVLCVCGLSALAACALGLRLAARHIRAGQRVTGTPAPSGRAAALARLVLGAPAFAALSFGSVILPEMAPVWHFLMVLVLSSTFAQMPDLLLSVVGGRVQLQLRLQERAAAGSLRDLSMYGHAPCCCLQPCFPPRPPRPADLIKLRFSILQLSLVQPVVGFYLLVVYQEALLGAGFVGMLEQQRVIFMIVKLISQLWCMSACKGLVELVSAFNQKAQAGQDLRAAKKLKYCQTFLLGMNIIPMLLQRPIAALWGDRALASGAQLSPPELQEFAHSIAVCIGSLLCVGTAERAFPVDASHYPELEDVLGPSDPFLT
uniref:Uncharacterized protein n=1 Tax=Pyrodinium bahamense TaxID=73915 RepID=A0A7R9ZWP8_9DINO